MCSKSFKSSSFLRRKSRRLGRKGRSRKKIATVKQKRVLARKNAPHHLEDAKKLLAELEKRRDERLIAEEEERSSKLFLEQNIPFRKLK